MRKLSSLALSAMFAVSAFATPASAQQMSASGSCGPAAGQYGWTDINGDTEVTSLYYQVNYSGVPAPTTVGVIIRYNDNLNQQQGNGVAFTAENSGGTFEGAIRANTAPEFQGGTGGADTKSKNTGNPGGSSNSPGDSSDRRGSKDGPFGHSGDGAFNNDSGGSGTQGALTPGNYVFYIYTGERKDVYDVHAGTVSLNAFVADEKGYLGKFSCGISTDQGSGPG
jgi:hypothetical protein